MKVFISQSGPRSLRIARYLQKWLRLVINDLEPWVSEDDIKSGKPWMEQLDEHLSKATIGIVVLTASNQLRPWINWEAGAIAKTVGGDQYCIPYLVDIEKVDVDLPMSVVQLRMADEEDTWKMVKTLNGAITKPLPSSVLKEAFDTYWDRLNKELAEARQLEDDPVPQRKMEGKVDEILERLRGLGRGLGTTALTTKGPGFIPRQLLAMIDDARSTWAHQVIGRVNELKPNRSITFALEPSGMVGFSTSNSECKMTVTVSPTDAAGEMLNPSAGAEILMNGLMRGME